MKQLLRKSVYLFIAVLLTIAPRVHCVIDEYSGEWHDTQSSLDGSFDKQSTVTSQTKSHRSLNGSQITETRSHTEDGEGNSIDYFGKETMRPDGSVTSHQEVSHTSKYGVKTFENTTWQYDKAGNMISETRSGGTERVEQPSSPDDGIEIESESDWENVGSGSEKKTFGYDSIKTEGTLGPSSHTIIQDPANERLYTLLPENEQYVLHNLYVCLEQKEGMEQAYGSMEAFYDDAFAKDAEEIYKSSMSPEDTERSIKELEKRKENTLRSITPKEKDLRCEFTGRHAMIAGHPAEQVLMWNKGRFYQELWLALDLSPLGVLNLKKIPNKAKDTWVFFKEPRLKRAFSRLVLKSKLFIPLGNRTELVKKIQRRKVKPEQFRVPDGYTRLILPMPWVDYDPRDKAAEEAALAGRIGQTKSSPRGDDYAAASGSGLAPRIYGSSAVKMKADFVSSFIEDAARKGIVIRKGPAFYRERLEAFYRQHPELKDEPRENVLKILIIMEYDWEERGVDKDALARQWLGEELYTKNKARLGR